MRVSNSLMKKNKFLILLFACLSMVLVSCGDDDDNSVEEWKVFNEKLLKDTIDSGQYQSFLSASGDGSVYYRPTTNMRLVQITDPNQAPLSTDSVICRYEGWYYNENYEKKIFDSTEGDYNQQGGKYIVLNGNMGNLYSYSTPIGVRDILQRMRIGDEYEICLPYKLSAGSSGIYGIYRYSTSTNTTSTLLVPAYTTVFYKIKLLKIYRRTTTDD